MAHAGDAVRPSPHQVHSAPRSRPKGFKEVSGLKVYVLKRFSSTSINTLACLSPAVACHQLTAIRTPSWFVTHKQYDACQYVHALIWDVIAAGTPSTRIVVGLSLLY